jgi:hypothetical protein
LYPIKSPTVPSGQERVRIIIHSNNTIHEIDLLINLIICTIQEINTTRIITTTTSNDTEKPQQSTNVSTENGLASKSVTINQCHN